MHLLTYSQTCSTNLLLLLLRPWWCTSGQVILQWQCNSLASEKCLAKLRLQQKVKLQPAHNKGSSRTDMRRVFLLFCFGAVTAVILVIINSDWPVIGGLLTAITFAYQVTMVNPVHSYDDEDLRAFEHRIYRRSSHRAPTSLIELLIGIFDTFYVTAKREERKIRQRHAIYPRLRSREEREAARYYWVSSVVEWSSSDQVKSCRNNNKNVSCE